MTDHKPLTNEEAFGSAELAMRWHGWGSPVGLGVAAVCLGLTALLIRFAILGI